MISKNFSRKDFDYWTKIKSHWRDMDSLRHINHAAYLTYMETSRLELYTRLGHNMDQWYESDSSILASMEVNYISQAVHPAEFDIGNRLIRIGTKSYDFLTAIFKNNDKKPLVLAKFVLVSIDYKTGKTIPVPNHFRKFLNPLRKDENL